MSSITINGVTISVSNGRVIIDGKDVTPAENTKQISIEIFGNVEQLQVDACERIIVTGNVGSVATASGDVECGNIYGSVATGSGDVTCDGDVSGSVQTVSGDVRARRVRGI